jgi:hypothetical protein
MKKLIVLMTIAFSMSLGAEVFRIEFESDYSSLSKRDLKRRVWKLERAVAQLQEKVFQLTYAKPIKKKRKKKHTCYVSAFGKTFTATRSTETAAKAEVLSTCSKGNHAEHCNDIKCGQ